MGTTSYSELPMTLGLRVLGLSVLFLAAARFAAAAPFPQQQPVRPAPQNSVRDLDVASPRATPEMTAKYNALRSRLQPSAAQWIAQQASLERRQPKPDVAALRATVRVRFGSSLAAMDVDALVFIVMMEAAQS